MIPSETFEDFINFLITLVDTTHRHMVDSRAGGLDVVEQVFEQDIVLLIYSVQQPKQELGL